MDKNNLTASIINHDNDTYYIDLDKLKVSHVKHRFKQRNLNWNDVLMLIDVSNKSKRFATLVIERDINCYLLRDSTTAIINQQMKVECSLRKEVSDGICEVIGLSNKFPIVHSGASLIPLPAKNKSRCQSWINANIVDYVLDAKAPHSIYLYCADQPVYLKIDISYSYLKHKYEEIYQLQAALLEINRHINYSIKSIQQSIGSNIFSSQHIGYGLEKTTLEQIFEKIAENIVAN